MHQALFVVAALMLCSGATFAGEIALTREGQPAATIVIADNPTASARLAAAELQYHVRRISGATLPIVSESGPVTGSRVLVGESGATHALGLPEAPLQREEYVIRFGDGYLALVGRDEEAGPLTGTPQRAPGKLGNAARFDGKSTVVTVQAPGLRDDQGSLEAWVWMPEAAPEKHGTILRVDGGGPWTYHILQRDAGSNVISYTTYDGTNGHGVRSQPLAEGWHHALGTWDAGTGKMALYVDGNLCGTADYVRTTCAGAAMGIGGITGTDPVSNCFIGLIDEVRVSKTVRDPQRDAGGGPYTRDADTACLYHFDEAAGPAGESVNALANAPLPGIFQSNGTLYAVYDFLERCCGVRWYAPGEIGIVCPQRETLVVSGEDRRHKPAMEMRTIAGAYLFMPTGKDRVPDADANLWKLRMRLGGRWKTTGHSFYHYPKKYLVEHPDWFAKTSADGAQVTAGEPSQMCYSNEGFIQQAAADAIRYFDGKGHEPGAAAGDETFGLVPMDNSTWCKCPACQAQLNPAQKDNPQFNNGYASDYIYEFTNRVAKEVGKVHPDMWIGQLAYSTYAYHPEKVKLEPNISVQMCLHTRNWWCPSMEANDRKLLADWRRLEPERPLYLWLYYCFPALNARSGNFHYFPGFFAHQVVTQMRLYHEAGIKGIFLENSSECDATYLMDQLEYYVTFKLADGPALDGDQLIDEFFVQ